MNILFEDGEPVSTTGGLPGTPILPLKTLMVKRPVFRDVKKRKLGKVEAMSEHSIVADILVDEGSGEMYFLDSV